MPICLLHESCTDPGGACVTDCHERTVTPRQLQAGLLLKHGDELIERVLLFERPNERHALVGESVKTSRKLGTPWDVTPEVVDVTCPKNDRSVKTDVGIGQSRDALNLSVFGRS